MEHQELKENIEEQIRDAMNILQLLEVELSANEDDEHIIRTVSNYENIQQSFLRLLFVYQSIHQGKESFYRLYQY